MIWKRMHVGRCQNCRDTVDIGWYAVFLTFPLYKSPFSVIFLITYASVNSSKVTNHRIHEIACTNNFNSHSFFCNALKKVSLLPHNTWRPRTSSPSLNTNTGRWCLTRTTCPPRPWPAFLLRLRKVVSVVKILYNITMNSITDLFWTSVILSNLNPHSSLSYILTPCGWPSSDPSPWRRKIYLHILGVINGEQGFPK